MNNTNELNALGMEDQPKVELLIDPTTGAIRQAGTTDGGASATINRFKRACENELYLFSKYVMQMADMTEDLHRPECNWLQVTPPRRKLWLMPRNTLKSSVCRSMIAHIIVQPQDDNVYFPGCQDRTCRYQRAEAATNNLAVTPCHDPRHRMPGCNTRVLLGRETATHAQAGVRWLEGQWESNEMLRALWPHRVWPKGATPRSGWNQDQMTLPRTKDFVEPTVFAIGVGGAATGWHFNVHTFDDIVTDKAADSPTIMDGAIQWHKDSRALMDDQQWSLEYTLGTHWNVRDLYYCMKHDYDGAGHGDPTVAARVRSLVEDGRIIFTKLGMNWEQVINMQAADPVRFALMQMNSLADPNVADFNMADVRAFDWDTDCIDFVADERDALLCKAYGAVPPPAGNHGRPSTLDQVLTFERVSGRDQYFKDNFNNGGIKFS